MLSSHCQNPLSLLVYRLAPRPKIGRIARLLFSVTAKNSKKAYTHPDLILLEQAA